MTTKTINGSYPSGYYLNPTYNELLIGTSGYVGGTDVTASTTQPSTIDNLGTVHGTSNGIVLADGGVITNGSATNSTALIEGTDPIKTGNSGAGPATITNYGTIKSDPSPSGYAYPNYHTSIVMNGGGKLINEASATVSNGVTFANAPGTVINSGYIGAAVFVKVLYFGGFSRRYSDPSVQMTDGGTVTNGATGQIKNGIAISGNTGTVRNYGYINQVTLSNGGAIINGSSTNTTELIGGVNPINISNAPSTIVNYGDIKSAPIPNAILDFVNIGYDYFESVVLSGSTDHVTNKSSGQISNGILIFSSGTVINDGTIGGSVYWGKSGHYYTNHGLYYFYSADIFPSVDIRGGGTVTNSTGSNTAAVLQNGIYISGGVGKVINNGTIGSPVYMNYKYPTRGGDAVHLAAGGSVTNGSATNFVADIAGTVGIDGGNGTVTNYGRIGAVGIADNGLVKNHGTIGNATVGGKGTITNDGSMGPVRLNGGGSVTNGGTTDLTAAITATGNGIVVKSHAGTIANFGSIASTTLPGGPIYSGVELDAGGTVTNGGSTNHTASIIGIAGITLDGPGTVTNFGLVAGTGDTAIKFTSPKGDLIEEGGSTIGGAVVGDGGTLEFAADGGAPSLTDDVSGFKSITIDTGAAWVLFSSATAAANSRLSNAGSLINDGHMTLSGQMSNTGSILNSVNSSIDVAGAVTNGGSITDNANSSMVLTGAVTNTGSINNGTNATASFAGPVANSGAIGNTTGGSIEFAGAVTNQGSVTNGGAGTINFVDPVTNKGTIANDTPGGVIDFAAQVVNSGTIANAANATIDLLADFAITTDPATKAGTFSNSGLVEKTGGPGVTIIRTGSASLSNSGTIDVEMGTLELTGNAPSIGGVIEGPGTIDFGPGNTTLTASVTAAGFAIVGTGAHVTSAMGVTYSGAFSATTNAELTLTIPSETWTLAGAADFSHATIDGFGHFVTNGATNLTSTILGGNVQWDNGGTLTETGLLTVAAGHTIAFNNDTGAVFDLAGNVGITGTGLGGFDNAGLLAKTAGSGSSSVAIVMANTGTVEVGSGTVDLQAPITGSGGKLQIDSGKILQADAAVGTGQTVAFDGTGDKLTLTDAADFHAKLSGFGTTDKLDLTQFGAGSSLAFSGNASQGTLTVTDGALQAKLTLLGQYTAAGFQIGTDGHGGSLITYTPPPSPNLVVDHLATPSA